LRGLDPPGALPSGLHLPERRQDRRRRFRVKQRAISCSRLPITVLWLDGSGREPSR
jgi:hypothetical protein